MEARTRKLADARDLEDEEKHFENSNLPNLGLNHLFEGYSLSEFPVPPKGVLVLDSTMTILEALQVLLDNNILSAPVEDTNQREDANWSKRYCGLVDMLDIVTFILAPFLEEGESAMKDKNAMTELSENESFFDFLRSARDDASVIPLGIIMDIKTSHVDFGGLYPVFEFHTFLNALVALGKHQLHRLLIFPEQGTHLLNIVTQSAMCRVLQEKVENGLDKDLASAFDTTTLKDVGLATKKDVYSVDITQTAMEAFMLIGRHRCGAVPVVNKKKRNVLLGNISARDIRSIFTDQKMYQRMFEPLDIFLGHLQSDRIDVTQTFRRPFSVISCKAMESLSSVFKKLVGFKIHRVYLVNDEEELLRVISLSDILGVLIK